MLCVHGGAGGLRRDALAPEEEQRLRAGLRTALLAGREILASGGAALDAVVAAVVELERAEAFNAGRGSVLTADGRVQMDASVMWGADRAAGAVACVERIAHPVEAARRLLDRGVHLMLVGPDADVFAEREGLRTEAPEYFVTEARRRELARAGGAALDHDAASLGTVGAVALDADGHLAAATSTGGMTKQAPGRVGDSPIPGAGTWADDRSCAVSATGHGERIWQAALSHEIDALMRLGGCSLREACQRGLAAVQELGGRAGCIAIDRHGNAELPFTTRGMARGVVAGDGEPWVALFEDESPPGLQTGEL